MNLKYDSSSLNTLISDLSMLSKAAGSAAGKCDAWVPVTDAQAGALTTISQFSQLTYDVAQALSGELLTIKALLSGASDGVTTALKAYETHERSAVEAIEAAWGEHYGGSDLPTVSSKRQTPVYLIQALSSQQSRHRSP
jgi:hypothetical protein